jgi:hypothetical protein
LCRSVMVILNVVNARLWMTAHGARTKGHA